MPQRALSNHNPPSLIRQLLHAELASEAVRVPGRRHGPDDAAHDELAALSAAGRVQHVEVVLAVLPPLELVEHAVGEGPEALRATAGVISRADRKSQVRQCLVLCSADS